MRPLSGHTWQMWRILVLDFDVFCSQVTWKHSQESGKEERVFVEFPPFGFNICG